MANHHCLGATLGEVKEYVKKLKKEEQIFTFCLSLHSSVVARAQVLLKNIWERKQE